MKQALMSLLRRKTRSSLAEKLAPIATPKVHPGLLHGTAMTQLEIINQNLLAFIRGKQAIVAQFATQAEFPPVQAS